MDRKRTRGPVTKSCLTCKRRHKKCDLRRPTCDRCTKGNYPCHYDTDATSPTTLSGMTLPSYDASQELVTASAFNQVPIDLYILSPDTWRTIKYIMAHYDRMLKLTYFKPVKYQIDTHRESMLSHLQSSSIARRIKIVSFKIHEAVIKGEESRYRAIFSEWVHQFQLELCGMWNRGLESQVMSTHLLNEALELSYLKTILLSNYDMYPYLRYTTPTFLQNVFSNPALWPDSTITSVSVAHILASPQCELGNFVVMDTIYAMAYGLPQHVEYDTSITSIPDDSMNFEWAHGCPTEFQIILAQINQCRDKNPNAPDWRDIEHRLITWQSRSNSHHAEWESWMLVAWLAVQETWRHTLLAYLYMAVCGASSDEPRVQFSVRQIFQIAKTIRKPEQPAASIHLFTQYFIAGICARTEKHRLLARHKLSDLSESTHWLIRGTIFVPVLDHLWLGAGAGGQPVKWSDYMLSRETVLPVVV